MKNNRKIIFFLSFFLLFSSFYTYAAELTSAPTFYSATTGSVLNMKEKKKENISFYYQNEIIEEKIEKIIDTLPEKIIENFGENNGKIIITDEEYLIDLYYIENGKKYSSGFSGLGKLYGTETWGMYWKNTIVISDKLEEEKMENTLIHEFGHYIDSLYSVSENLSDRDIEKIGDLTSLYSPNNNKEHIMENKREAFAESFYLWNIEKEKVKENIFELNNFFDIVCEYHQIFL